METDFDSRHCIYLSLFLIVQTYSGAQQVSYSKGTGESFDGLRRPRREADDLPASSDVEFNKADRGKGGGVVSGRNVRMEVVLSHLMNLS